MIVHRCDVCRNDFTPEAAKAGLQTVMFRVNLEKISTVADPSHVLLTLDICSSPACRKTGITQLHEAGLKACLAKAGLA